MMELLDFLSIAILHLDATGRITTVNSACEQLLGNSRRQLTGQKLEDLLLRDTGWHSLLDNHHTRIERNSHLTLLPSTETITADVAITPTPEGTLLEIHPQTRANAISRTAERQHQAEHNRLIIKNLAHEIRNPLAGIKGAAQRLAETDPTKQQKYLDLIIAQVDRLNQLLIQMNGEGQLNICHENIHRTLEESLAIFTQDPANRSLTITRAYDPSLPDIPHDPHRIQQVILNLLSNAAKATDHHGSITLTTATAHQYTIGNIRHKTALSLSISDDGCGIAEADQTAIFQPMVSHFSHGSGLGLAIVQNIIHQHQGAIELFSQPGQTTFTLLLPIQRKSL